MLGFVKIEFLDKNLTFRTSSCIFTFEANFDTYSSIEGHEGVLEPKGRVTSSVEFVAYPDISWPPMTTIKWSSNGKKKYIFEFSRQKYTLFEIFIFCPKIQLWFPVKIVDFLGRKTRENVVVLYFLAVDNFDFTRKIVKKIVWKTRENVGVLSKLNFWTKIRLFEECGQKGVLLYFSWRATCSCNLLL